jgi:mannose-6-phosphate isomerase-like protein (cupin superfamily)
MAMTDYRTKQNDTKQNDTNRYDTDRNDTGQNDTKQNGQGDTHSEDAAFPGLTVVNLKQLADSVEQSYKNFVVVNINNHCVRLAVMQGEFRWHQHPRSDECFLVVEGELEIDLADGRGCDASNALAGTGGEFVLRGSQRIHRRGFRGFRKSQQAIRLTHNAHPHPRQILFHTRTRIPREAFSNDITTRRACNLTATIACDSVKRVSP